MTNEDQLNRMAELSGENANSSYRYDVPSVSIHGNTGEFAIFRTNDDGETEITNITDPFTIHILKVRRKLEGDQGDDVTYSTTEYTSPKQKVKLYERTEAGATHVKTATAQELRDEFSFLKVRDVVYFVMADQDLATAEVMKMKIKGGSASNWYEFLGKLKIEKLHTFLVHTTLGKEEVEGRKGNAYYAVTFSYEKSNEDINTVEARMNEINSELEKVDASVSDVSNEEVVYGEPLDYPQEEIDESSIPF